MESEGMEVLENVKYFETVRHRATYSSSNYNKYLTKNRLARFLIGRFLDKILETVSMLHCDDVLEIGCGEGFVISHLRRHGIKARFEGVDRNAEALAIASELNPGVSFSEGNVTSLHFAAQSFDLVMALEILEHLKEPIRALTELCRVSRHTVIVSVPNEPLFSLGNFARGKHLARLGRDPEHVQFWNQAAFIKMIKPYFREIRNISSFPWTICVGMGPRR